METAMKPMTSEAISITEKKLSMTLDEIIKMSKKSSLKKKAASRSGVRSHGSVTAKYSKGALIQKRSNFREKHGAWTSEVVGNSSIASFSQKQAIVKTHNESGSRASTIGIYCNEKRLLQVPVPSVRLICNHCCCDCRCLLQKLKMVGAPSEETLGKHGWGTQKVKTMDARFTKLKFRRPHASAAAVAAAWSCY